MPTAKQDKTRKNGLTVKDLIVMGRFRCAIDGLLYDRRRIIVLSLRLLLLISPSEPLCFRGQYFYFFLQKCQSVGIDNYWGHYFSA